MLINTVILFLRDALPIFIVLVLLLSTTNHFQLRSLWILYGLAAGAGAGVALLLNVDFISQSLDSLGLELLFSAIYGATYGAIIVFYCFLLFEKKRAPKGGYLCAILILALVFSLNGANFLIYITGFWSQHGVVVSLLVGVVLGVGICMSISILLYFFIQFCMQKFSPFVAIVLLVLFGAGQILQLSSLLLQIDVMPSGILLWDSTVFISENSEVGRFLTALLGYDASLTLSQLLLYLFALLIPLLLFIIRHWHNRHLLIANALVKDVT